ncbi:MAG: DUF5658 family protein [Candidatus Aminicenantales bacterium]
MRQERRILKDRRQRPTKPLSRFSLRGRRKKARRKDEAKNYYVDRYETRYFIFIVAILFLCILDGYFTFSILQHGGEEMNPFMATLLIRRPALSLGLKYIITAGSLLILIAHKNFQFLKILKISYLIILVFLIYFFLVIYELYVFFFLSSSPL